MPHPLSTEEDDLVPPPILLVATTDAALRFYCFGHLRKQEVLLAQPQALPAQAPAWLVAGPSAGATGAGAGAVGAGMARSASDQATDTAARTALPDDSEVSKAGLLGNYAVVFQIKHAWRGAPPRLY